ncbi:MAG TPA: sulfatase-like hydrolase/transferase, partial [bacterium]|nr:sulfatase-like hydrolase/transferase [bacterium]
MSFIAPGWHLVNVWAWRVLLWQWAVLLVLFTAFRLLFLAQYWPLYKTQPPAQVALSLLVGLRFDASTIMFLAGIPGIVFLLVSPWAGRPWAFWVLFAYWAALTLAVTILHAVDLYYYGFVGRRVSFEAVSMLREWRPIAAMVAQGYGLQTVAGLALLGAGLAAAIWGFGRLAAHAYQPVPAWSLILQALLLFLAGVLVGRGGLQTKPLSEGMAFRTDNMALGHLSLNPVFTSVLALDHRATVLHYYPEEQAERVTRTLLELPDPPPNPRYPLLHQTAVAPRPAGSAPKNLVILTIESLSPRFIGAMGARLDVTPRFDELTREGMFFDHFYASGTRSLEGIPAILTGYPALPTQALLGSPLEQSGMS